MNTTPRFDFDSAFTSTATERSALAVDALAPINLDIPTVVNSVLGTCKRVGGVREEITRSLPSFEVAHLDKLETYAEALAVAHTNYITAANGNDVQELVERATKIRDRLRSDANVLAERGLIDGQQLDDLKGGGGYLNVTYDLAALVKVLRERWSKIVGKSAIEESELVEAKSLYEQLTHASADRSRQSDAAIEANETRQRAYTLVLNAYEQTRRAVIYVRWDHGDAEKLVPSLWAGRGGRGSLKENVAPSPAPVVPAPTEPAVPVGLPGSSPFISS